MSRVGVRAWWQKRGMRDPVAGAYRVTRCGLPMVFDSSWEPHRLYGVISAPGVDPMAVEVWRQMPHRRWPRSGDVLPVFVDRRDPSLIRVRWERVPRRDRKTDARRPYIPRSHRSAEQLAAQMRRQQKRIADRRTPESSGRSRAARHI